MLTLVLALIAQETPEPPLLRVGETIAGEITDAEPVVHTPTLDTSYTGPPVVGKTFLIEIEEPGPFTIELVSYLFDAYLVLRDGEGRILAEDDDGAVGIHARVTAELETHAVYLMDACALHGRRGAFELDLRSGRPAALSPGKERAAERADLERTVEVRERILGPEHPKTVASLDNLATLLRAQGDYASVRPYLERALAIKERVLGPGHPDTASSLNNLAVLLYSQGDYASARPYYARALAIREKSIGPEHPDTATSLNNLAALLQAQGDNAGARPYYERVLAIREKALGPEHPDTATSLNNLAALLQAQGDNAAARPYHERSLAIREQVLGPEHPDTATSLNNLAALLQAQGDNAAARPYHERSLAIREQVLGPEHPDTASSLNNLAVLLWDQGDYAAARPYYERSLAIREQILGPEHPDTAMSLDNLGVLLWDQGDYAAARPSLERALAIREKALGPEHSDTAMSLDNLGVLLTCQGDYAVARPYLERALAIREKALGPEHPDTATSLNNLADLLRNQGDYAAARPSLERALAIREKALGPEHPDTAQSLNNLAHVLLYQGDRTAARRHLEHALPILERNLGPQHPRAASALGNLAMVLADEGSIRESSLRARSALVSRLAQARSVLWALSEKERLLYLGLETRNLHLCLLGSTGPANEGSVAQTYELSLAWRGLVSRTMIESREHLKMSLPEGGESVLAELQRVQAELSKKLYATGVADLVVHERAIRELRERRNELEVELQRLVGSSQERVLTLAELQGALERGSAFLDFYVHPLFEPAQYETAQRGGGLVRSHRWTDDYVSAWIVRPDRELLYVDLGPAAEIESAVKGWLGEVVAERTPSGSRGIAAEAKDISQGSGTRLRERLWEPLVAPLGGVERVFVRPDSFLGTLPLEAIPLGGGKYLIEEKSFVYVQTPLDLVEREDQSTSRPQSLLVAGGVDFNRRAGLEKNPGDAPLVASVARGDELRGSLNHSWSRLSATEGEARTVSDLHEAAFADEKRLLLSAEAPTEERLKEELPRYSVLHLATHGFFNPTGTVSLWDSAQEEAQKDRLEDFEREIRSLVGQLPGLLTGLVCAGANGPAPSGRDDGLLTAEEVLWLDLSKVELVVLSACETALGERRSGEGMIGLRRAFGLAGAKTVVSSLWSVKDQSTSELMQRFYENLWLKKQGRAEALQNAQLEMLARNRATEGDALPSTWGAFVLSGEWR